MLADDDDDDDHSGSTTIKFHYRLLPLTLMPMYTPTIINVRTMLPMPRPRALWARLRASRDFTSAVARSPAAIAERHWDERRMATMPIGQQQHRVTKIE